jgi:hypothetical protein
VRSLRAIGLYAVLTVLLTYPLALRLRLLDAGDSAYFAWAVSWSLHALSTAPLSLPHGNIYHPARNTLGMDEPVLGTTVMVAPLSLLSHDAVLLFGVARLLTFVASALGAYLLARDVGCGEGPALFAGAAFAFSPIRTDQLAHLSTLGSQWLPLVLLFLFRFFRREHVRDALLAGLFFALATYACGYHGFLGLLILPFAALALLWGRWALTLRALPGVALAALALLPLRALHAAAFTAHGFVRPEDQAVFHSASLESFLATSSWNRVWGELTTPFRTLGSNNLFPGLVVPSLVAFGVFTLLREKRRPSREALALGLMTLAAVIVALGPEVRLMGHVLVPSPLGTLRRLLPSLQSVRVFSRAGIFMALGLTQLAAFAMRRFANRPRLLAGIAVVALLETLIVPIPMPAWAQVIDTRKPTPPVYQWLASQPGEIAVVELPIVKGDLSRPAYDESVYMVRSTLHWKRLVNGNAGVEPEHYRRVRELARRFPSQESIEALRALGTRYVLLHRGGYGPNQWARVARDLPGFLECCLKVAAEFPDVTVYEIEPGHAGGQH